MKKFFVLILVLLLKSNAFAQITFEQGYYIDNSGQKIEGLIKNKDWESNPKEFDYKIKDNTEAQRIDITTAKEFGIQNEAKFKRFKVEIDRSSGIVAEMSQNRNPEYTNEVLFLKVLVEGKANLYYYNDRGLIKYFFNVDSLPVKQLVYKNYLTQNNNLAENNLFKEQLLNELKCEAISFQDIQSVEYKQNKLVSLFIKYNECQNTDYLNFTKKEKRDLFNFSLKPGYKYSTLFLENPYVYFNDVDFGSRHGFSFGVEAEFILPVNLNKWSFVIEPTFQNYNKTVNKVSIVTIGEEITGEIKYQSVEVSTGFRHYFFLNDQSKIFTNTSVLYDFTIPSSTVSIVRDDGTQLFNLDVFSRSLNLIIGLGYKYNDLFSTEIRYQTKRDILANYKSWEADYSTLSFVLGISFF